MEKRLINLYGDDQKDNFSPGQSGLWKVVLQNNNSKKEKEMRITRRKMRTSINTVGIKRKGVSRTINETGRMINVISRIEDQENQIYKTIKEFLEREVEEMFSVRVGLHRIDIFDLDSWRGYLVHFDADNGFDIGCSMLSVISLRSENKEVFYRKQIRSSYCPMTEVAVKRADDESGFIVSWTGVGQRKEEIKI